MFLRRHTIYTETNTKKTDSSSGKAKSVRSDVRALRGTAKNHNLLKTKVRGLGLEPRTNWLKVSRMSLAVSWLQHLFALFGRYWPSVFEAFFASSNRGGKLVVTICHHAPG